MTNLVVFILKMQSWLNIWMSINKIIYINKVNYLNGGGGSFNKNLTSITDKSSQQTKKRKEIFQPDNGHLWKIPQVTYLMVNDTFH